MATRTAFKLTEQEARTLRRLQPKVKRAWRFWKAVCRDRGLDHKTLITLSIPQGLYSALPRPGFIRRVDNWRWPYQLVCLRQPIALPTKEPVTS